LRLDEPVFTVKRERASTRVGDVATAIHPFFGELSVRLGQCIVKAARQMPSVLRAGEWARRCQTIRHIACRRHSLVRATGSVDVVATMRAPGAIDCCASVTLPR